MECVTVEAPHQQALDNAIFRTMEGRGDEFAQAARAAVAALRSAGVDGVILGCTEIPIMLGPAADDADDVINPTALLAEAAVRAAM